MSLCWVSLFNDKLDQQMSNAKSRKKTSISLIWFNQTFYFKSINKQALKNIPYQYHSVTIIIKYNLFIFSISKILQFIWWLNLNIKITKNNVQTIITPSPIILHWIFTHFPLITYLLSLLKIWLSVQNSVRHLRLSIKNWWDKTAIPLFVTSLITT